MKFSISSFLFAFAFLALTISISAQVGLKRQANQLPERFFGLTIDDVTHEAEITAQLQNLRKSNPSSPLPVIRVVFDIGKDDKPSSYHDFVKNVSEKKLAFIVGEIMDSQYVHICAKARKPEKCYSDRTKRYFSKLKNWIDIWEIGNEVNGEWVGWNGSEWEDDNITAKDMERVRESVPRQIADAYNFLKIKQKKPVAVTFYFNDDDEGEHSWTDDKKKQDSGNNQPVQFGQHYAMLAWARKYKSLFPDLDYVFISYYQDNEWIGKNENRRQFIPSYAQWARIFEKFHNIFPTASLGFGEVGPECRFRKGSCVPQEETEEFKNLPAEKKCLDRNSECCRSAQPIYIKQYYSDWDQAIRLELKDPDVKRLYIGGYFYWQYTDDVINNKSQSAQAELEKVFNQWFKP